MGRRTGERKILPSSSTGQTSPGCVLDTTRDKSTQKRSDPDILPARKQIHYSDSWDEQGGPNLYGNLKALYLLKQSNRHLKVLLSIGGWNHSQNGTFAKPVSTSSGQARFVETSVRIVEDYGLDGLDCDWEYPENDKEARDYVELLRQLRQGLDGLQQKLGMHSPHGFELTVAAVSRVFTDRKGEMHRDTNTGACSPEVRTRSRNYGSARWTATCHSGT